MALLRRLRTILTRSRPGTGVGERRATTAAQREDVPREKVLRNRLIADPNDGAAFRELAELVRARAEGTEPVDPLIGDHDDVPHQVSADVAVWALAEELAGNPRAWFPLIKLGLLSLHDDHEGAMRRFHAACEREDTGKALTESIVTLREAGLPGEALGLGVGQWSPTGHEPEAGRQVVLAALDAQRPSDARRHLRDLADAAESAKARRVLAELEPLVAAAEAAQG